MSYLVNFWRTDKFLGSRSIRIQPGIHFWGLESPKIKFRVLKRTFSISDVFISIFPSISELSLKQVPQAFGTIWGQIMTLELIYGLVPRKWGGWPRWNKISLKLLNTLLAKIFRSRELPVWNIPFRFIGKAFFLFTHPANNLSNESSENVWGLA